MIPVLLLVGLLAGRWHVIALAAVAWPLLLVISGVTTDPVSLLGGSGLAIVNTAIGVVAHKAAMTAARSTARAFGAARRRHSV